MDSIAPGNSLAGVNTLSEPFNGGALDAAELTAHCSFQHYDPVVVVDRSEAEKYGKDFIGAKGRFDNPVRQ